jgi:chemotaxis protein MotB
MVEGHTYARRNSKERSDNSNRELSADRANSARRLLDGSGLRARQVTRVVGFADHDPLVKDNPLDPQNRRVSILVARTRPAEPLPTVKARAALEQMQRKQ